MQLLFMYKEYQLLLNLINKLHTFQVLGRNVQHYLHDLSSLDQHCNMLVSEISSEWPEAGSEEQFQSRLHCLEHVSKLLGTRQG